MDRISLLFKGDNGFIESGAVIVRAISIDEQHREIVQGAL